MDVVNTRPAAVLATLVGETGRAPRRSRFAWLGKQACPPPSRRSGPVRALHGPPQPDEFLAALTAAAATTGAGGYVRVFLHPASSAMIVQFHPVRESAACAVPDLVTAVNGSGEPGVLESAAAGRAVACSPQLAPGTGSGQP